MFENLDEKYHTVADFFEKIVQNEKFTIPNSIILHGPDIIAQYHFAMLLARAANCLENKTQNCECQNCRWIKADEHPEVNTVSKINFKPENDDSKTVISVKQTELVKDKLVISSDYHRFFIFCDAEIRELTEEEQQKYKNFEFLNQKIYQTDKGTWVPLGLNKNCFTDIVANSMLKSIEEPPVNVTFVFLTENIENIISTIVSRSQAFYIPGYSRQNFNYDFLREPLKNYPYINSNKAVYISEFLLQYAKDNELPLSAVIKSVLAFLTDFAKNNADNAVLKKKAFTDIENIQNIEKLLKSGTKDFTVTDEIGYFLTRPVS